MKTWGKLIALLIAVLSFINASHAQDKKAETRADVKNKIASQQYTFIADYVTAQRGYSRPLNATDYDFRVTRDSVVSYLPYFGRAYFDVPYSPTDGGIKFTSTKFDYKVTERKKGGWIIQITPQDVKNTDKIFMNVSVDGYASLSVNSSNRDEINFNGYLK